MAKQIVNVKIDHKGRITMDYLGFKGTSCNKAEEMIKKKLVSTKLKISSQKMKTEKQTVQEVEHE